ncbi:DUF3572 domain-containing protein [Pseudorhodoplanes sp.]|jgi:hypothetical protein|uniref:DUF3572 domain-containing protein n=1 Tax=Pseudorhodoplanes sp. TaxID=1934341 RepID=UPI002B840B91|nr:DUF3572 domain-containing protein [Pseudorhodoplanes sp.]HWV43703.1 DUF3572 domain-containing protein [Pseudorhodoplanes sp.]
MINNATLRSEDAEIMAIQALGFLAADAERLGRFLAATGMGPGDVRAAAREKWFLAGVLEHLAQHESDMIAFAENAGVAPERVAQARRLLSGPPVERDIP